MHLAVQWKAYSWKSQSSWFFGRRPRIRCATTSGGVTFHSSAEMSQWRMPIGRRYSQVVATSVVQLLTNYRVTSHCQQSLTDAASTARYARWRHHTGICRI